MSDEIRRLLQVELSARRNRNSQYSLRAFARDLGIGLGSMSEVMTGKRALSPKNLMKVLQNLNLSPEQKEKLLNTNKEKPTPQDEHQLMLEDQFKLISDWYYIGILNLAKIKSNKGTPAWISQRLGIEPYMAAEALERLQRLGLLKVEKNKLIRTSRPITTSSDLPSTAIRKHHSQNLILAEKAIHNVPVELREMGSVTMPVSLKNLTKVKELLLKTRKKAADLLEDENATEVYTLSFQLFPLTEVKTKRRAND
ncbi:MAG: TIGR02147 family protein [Pseudobdellovibrio sp.]